MVWRFSREGVEGTALEMVHCVIRTCRGWVDESLKRNVARRFSRAGVGNGRVQRMNDAPPVVRTRSSYVGTCKSRVDEPLKKNVARRFPTAGVGNGRVHDVPPVVHTRS